MYIRAAALIALTGDGCQSAGSAVNFPAVTARPNRRVAAAGREVDKYLATGRIFVGPLRPVPYPPPS